MDGRLARLSGGDARRSTSEERGSRTRCGLSGGDARHSTSEGQRAADGAPWCVWSRSVL